MASTSSPDTVLDASTLDPLPSVLKRGLMAVSFFGFLSFISSSTLLFYLTLKLVKWRIHGQAREGYNQFLLLVYNLLIADIQQSLAFLLTARWLVEDKIDVHTSTCWAEGWFVSTGDLASGIWIFAIAMHTFFAIIKDRKLPPPAFLSTMVGLWLFIYAMSVAGVASHRKDYYVRAGAWCWIGEAYPFERLWLHYFWIFIAMFGTLFLYALTYSTLRMRLRLQSRAISSNLEPLASRNSNMDARNIHRAARYMIIYPTIYVLCTLPLAAARMAAMNGHIIPYWYYCLAGAAITSCGWLDVLLYACTRRVLVFAETPPPVNELGLETFGMFDSPERFWSFRTTVEGGVLMDPTVSTRRRGHIKVLSRDWSNRSDVPSHDGILDDTFGIAVPNAITTRTTIQVTTEPRLVALGECTAQLPLPIPSADSTPLDRSPVDTIFGSDNGVREAANAC